MSRIDKSTRDMTRAAPRAALASLLLCAALCAQAAGGAAGAAAATGGVEGGTLDATAARRVRPPPPLLNLPGHPGPRAVAGRGGAGRQRMGFGGGNEGWRAVAPSPCVGSDPPCSAWAPDPVRGFFAGGGAVGEG